MCRSLASCAGIPTALLVLVVPASHAIAQSSAWQTVTVTVSPIVALAVHAGTDYAGGETASENSEVLLRYDLTTNVRGAVLEGALHSSSSTDVSMKVLAGTTCGASEGTVVLRSDGRAVPIVTGIQPGLENGQTISVSVEGDLPAGFTVALTLRDPGSGVSQTVETPL